MCQHFSGHKVKQLYTAIRNPRATNSRWRNVAAHGYKRLDILKYSFLGLITILISLMVHRLGFQGMEEAFRNCIDPAVTFPTHALADVVLL
jgi:hypothetical protein